jgi:N-acetyltransferase 10
MAVHWIGTSFGVTRELFSFWSKNEMCPLYVRQTANELTGEHSCLMIKPMQTAEVELPGGLGADWLEGYRSDF